ncbi:MAG: hypothetical protein Q7S54_01265 [bacterium]|nr:hypothetical protein [bacterium]
MSYRLIATILLILSIIFLPYWIYVPALVAAMAAFPLFWESILLGFLIDVLYGEKISSLSSFIFSAGFLALAGLFILLPLRERLRSHA